MNDQPLQLKIENDELVIRIGIGTLAIAAENCPKFHEYPGKMDPPYCKVVDPLELAKDVRRMIEREKDDGSSPLRNLIDDSIVAAFDDGSIAFDEAVCVLPPVPAAQVEVKQ